MEFLVKKADLVIFPCDLLVVNEFLGVKTPGGGTGAVNSALGGLIGKFAKEEGFTGKEGETLLFRTLGKMPASRVLVVGLGDRKDFKIETVRRVTAISVKRAKEAGAKTVGSILHGAGWGGIAPREAAQAMAEGAFLADYGFTKFKKENSQEIQKRAVKSFTIVERDPRKVRLAEEGIRLGALEARGVMYARDLVNEPSLHMSPARLKQKAEEIAKTSRGAIKVRSYDQQALEKMGAGGILAVAMGSDCPPYLVHLIWKPKGAKKRVAIVGKAITFDSGGLSLQPADSMVTMKCDMAGAAAVLGVFSALTEWNPKVEVHGIFAACENMPSGKAIRPGDIVRAMNGKTIEILNTDAEGRVTLADSLHYATKQKPDYLIDLATLTAACVVALGEQVAGVMGNNTTLIRKILAAGERAGEYLWELPMPKEYRELTLSKFADLKNIAGRSGGAITAGIFLKEFVGETPWVHIDIAGPAFAEKEVFPYVPLGGTGFAVRTLLHFLKEIR